MVGILIEWNYYYFKKYLSRGHLVEIPVGKKGFYFFHEQSGNLSF